MSPEALPKGPAKRGSGSGGDAGGVHGLWGASIPLRGRIFLSKKLLRP